jgi:hypothetical protein
MHKRLGASMLAHDIVMKVSMAVHLVTMSLRGCIVRGRVVRLDVKSESTHLHVMQRRNGVAYGLFGCVPIIYYLALHVATSISLCSNHRAHSVALFCVQKIICTIPACTPLFNILSLISDNLGAAVI